MYLRKYSRDKKSSASEPDDSTGGTGARRKRSLLPLMEATMSATKSRTQDSDWKNASKTKEKVKKRDLIDANENTQSDIFSGFMTVAIHNNNKEIEVIRRT